MSLNAKARKNCGVLQLRRCQLSAVTLQEREIMSSTLSHSRIALCVLVGVTRMLTFVVVVGWPCSFAAQYLPCLLQLSIENRYLASFKTVALAPGLPLATDVLQVVLTCSLHIYKQIGVSWKSTSIFWRRVLIFLKCMSEIFPLGTTGKSLHLPCFAIICWQSGFCIMASTESLWSASQGLP